MKKSVTFDESQNRTYPMVVWSYAYRMARQWNYREALDRSHFKQKISIVESMLRPFLAINHRNTIYNERFK